MSREHSEMAGELDCCKKPWHAVRLKEVPMMGRKGKIIMIMAVLLMAGGGFWILGRGRTVLPKPLSGPLPSQEAGVAGADAEELISPEEGQYQNTVVAPPTTPMEILTTPRTGLESTDPSTVALASGEPQLVEFFAFW
jgi:hypothetical protein